MSKPISTQYGIIDDVRHASHYADGAVESILVGSRTELQTPYGVLVPQYETDEARRIRQDAVWLHPDGTLKNISLNESTVIETPLGAMPAELITFYEDGSLNRLLHLNGKMSGFYSWKDEYKLARETTLETPLGRLTTKLMALHLYPSGALKSLTLWPLDTLTVDTPAGRTAFRIGIALYESGAVRSFEPEDPLPVTTPIGEMIAFDPAPEGVTGDVNSLQFDESGSVVSLRTIADKIHIDCAGQTRTIEPGKKENACGDPFVFDPVPLTVTFAEDELSVGTDPQEPKSVEAFSRSRCMFNVERLAMGVQKIQFPCGDE